MKTSYVLLFCLFALLNSGCKKCETTTHYDFPAATELYFGMYKMGNWWVYENQDGTKKDSIYLTWEDNTNNLNNGRDVCVTWNNRECTLKNNYLYANKSNANIAYTNPYNAKYDIMETSVSLFDGNTSEVLATHSKNSLYQCTILPVYLIYNNVLKTNHRRYFAPNIGLIGWETTTDTFTLKKHYIQ